MYETLTPVTHHFYPLQNYTERSDPPFKGFLSSLESGKEAPSDNLLYLHIPFCEKRCMFCPFHVRVKRDVSVYETYVQALEREIEMLGRLPYVQDMDFKAVYFGGGSPSLLTVGQVARLYDALRRHLRIRGDAEWTFEGEPTGLGNRDLLAYLASEGTGRMSFGIQTFDRELRERMNIAATVEDAIRCTDLAREVGIPEVNVDMMFYMPGQTIDDLESDLAEVGRHGFDSVDYYYMSYYAMPKAAFHGMEKGTFPKRPAREMRLEMGKLVRQRMGELGYDHVSDHVFARSGRPLSEYYRLLWGGGHGEYRAETLAVGASARGYLSGYGYANTLGTDDYVRQVGEGELPVFKVSDRLEDPANRGMVFFPKFFSVDMARAPEGSRSREVLLFLVDQGYATLSNDSVTLTDQGKDWIPNITVEFFEEPQRVINDAWVEQLDSHYSNRVTL